MLILNISKSILNIAGGKIGPIEHHYKDLYNDARFLVNLDSMYLNSTPIHNIIKDHEIFDEDIRYKRIPLYKNYNCNYDIYEFLEKYHIKFDGITMYRFLEHVPKVKILYFIYLLSTIIKIGGMVDVIVPDYKALAKRILEENVKDPNFEAQDIITTFELLNEDYSPHCSIWTTDRIVHFFELEGRFQIKTLTENYKFDGRDIYIRFLAQRIEG